MEDKEIQNESIIDRKIGLELLYKMILIRRFEEKSAELYTKEKIRGFLHLYIGEEAVAVGVMESLTEADNILSTYREHGHALARGVDPGSIMAEMYGKQEGCSKGRGGSMHLFDTKKRFYGGNAIVGGHLPMAVGMALASKKQQQDQITWNEGPGRHRCLYPVSHHACRWGCHVPQSGHCLLGSVLLEEADRRVEDHDGDNDRGVFQVPDGDGDGCGDEQYHNHRVGELPGKEQPEGSGRFLV